MKDFDSFEYFYLKYFNIPLEIVEKFPKVFVINIILPIWGITETLECSTSYPHPSERKVLLPDLSL